MNYSVTGKVIEGRKLGRELGFATANIAVPDGMQARDGVYAARVAVGGKTYGAMANLGHRPSAGGGARMLEVHLFGFAGDLYGQTLKAELLHYVRAEEKFPTLEELQRRIAADREEILNFLKNH